MRINPNEVHVNDPELIDTIYPGGHKKVDKDPYLMSQFGYVVSKYQFAVGRILTCVKNVTQHFLYHDGP